MLAIASRALATVNSYISPVKPMPAEESMELLEARLKTFQAPRSTGRKRASNAKGGKSGKWDLKSPSAEELAQAGFYFAPTGPGSDNVTCFCCEKSLDGWEEGDNPYSEHLHFSSDCAWAILMAIENDVNEELQTEDPMSERMLEARRQTFRDQWPHERKRGWTCKIQKMIEGGWYFCPSPEGDDQANCVYCKKSLWGWEPKDKPYDEHKKRSPDCAFFYASQGKPATKSRKGRVSKASRVVSQSEATIDIGESVNADQDDDDATQASTLAADASTVSTTTKAKRSTKGKKTTAKNAKSKTTVAPMENTEPVNESAAVLPTRNTRGKKRTSEQMLEASVEIVEPPKKRATRARASTQVSFSENLVEIASITMEDNELPAVRSKKAGKGSKTRALSTARKPSTRVASTRSTTSQAPLPVPFLADDDIDAQSAADLGQFDSDDDSDNWKVLGEDDSITSQIYRPKSARTSSVRTQTVKRNSKLNSSIIEDRSAPLKDPISTTIAAPAQDIESKTGRKGKQAMTAMAQHQIIAQDNDAMELKQFEESLEADDHEQFASALEIKEVSAMDNGSANVSQVTLGPTTSLIHETKDSVPLDDQSQGGGKASKGGPKRKPPVKKSAAKGKNAKKTSIEIAFEPHKEINDEDVASELEAMQVEAQIQVESSAILKDIASEPTANRISQGSRPVRGQFASPEASPQSSDAENHPPSSRPSQTRPPLAGYTPTQARSIRIPLAPSTPTASPSKSNTGLQTTYPWTSADMDYILNGTLVAERENINLKNLLSSEEKKMTLEEWIKCNAKKNEDKLKADCEMMVGKFESEGVRALKTLEGIVCSD